MDLSIPLRSSRDDALGVFNTGEFSLIFCVINVVSVAAFWMKYSIIN
jgi:hypothetical protein